MPGALEAARATAERNEWSHTFRLLTEAGSSEPFPPEGLELLADAAWWMSDIDVCIDSRERAYAAYLDRGDEIRAGLMCLGLAEDNFMLLASSVGNGWLNRAERLLGDAHETAEYGWLARLRAVLAYEGDRDLERALEESRAAYEAGARSGDQDLQAVSIHDQGRIMVAGGQLEEGLALMEEAMVGAVGGELGARTTGRIYCNMIDTCEKMADYRRASQWDDAARRWCARVGQDSGFPGICRVKRAEIMRLRGAWSEAEREARKATEELRGFLPYAAQGFEQIGEIRLRVGDFAGAEEAFRQSHELGHDPEPGLALLRLAVGDLDSAGQLIKSALDGTQLPLERAHLLPALVDVALALDELAEAAEASTELATIVDDFHSEALSAADFHVRGVVAHAHEDVTGAIEHLQRAWKLWNECDAPYEAAQSRLQLGWHTGTEGPKSSPCLRSKRRGRRSPSWAPSRMRGGPPSCWHRRTAMPE